MTHHAITRRLFIGAGCAAALPALPLPSLGVPLDVEFEMDPHVFMLQTAMDLFAQSLNVREMPPKHVEYLDDAVKAAKALSGIKNGPYAIHEYYTPLNAISGFPEIICLDLPSPSMPHAYAGIIGREVQRTARRLSELSAMQRGKSLA